MGSKNSKALDSGSNLQIDHSKHDSPNRNYYKSNHNDDRCHISCDHGMSQSDVIHNLTRRVTCDKHCFQTALACSPLAARPPWHCLPHHLRGQRQPSLHAACPAHG
eukprot:200588-Amphidinium_carterae.1